MKSENPISSCCQSSTERIGGEEGYDVCCKCGRNIKQFSGYMTETPNISDYDLLKQELELITDNKIMADVIAQRVIGLGFIRKGAL